MSRSATLYVVVCADGLPHADDADQSQAYMTGDGVVNFAHGDAARLARGFDEPASDDNEFEPPLACGPHRVVTFASVDATLDAALGQVAMAVGRLRDDGRA